MKRLQVAGLAVVIMGCVTAPAPKMSAAEAFAPASREPASASSSRAALGPPKEWARQFRRDIDCERAAQELKLNHGEEAAWTYLKACITKGGFSQLEALCQNWQEQLKTRSEAPSLIAQVLGVRGGHLRVDLELLQQKRIPLFDLPSALRQTGAFKGRYLVFVGKISEAKASKGKTELVVLEQALASETASVISGPRTGSISSSSGGGMAAWRSNSRVMGSGSASASYSNQTRTESGNIETRVTDVFEETGQEVIARIQRPDPFLTVDKNLVFLVRFDGTLVTDRENTSEGEEPLRTALVTLISYHDI